MAVKTDPNQKGRKRFIVSLHPNCEHHFVWMCSNTEKTRAISAIRYIFDRKRGHNISTP